MDQEKIKECVWLKRPRQIRSTLLANAKKNVCKQNVRFCDCKKFNSVRNLFNLSSKLITAVPRRINLISVPDKIHKKRNWIVGNFLKQSQQTCNTHCPGDWVSDQEQTKKYNYIENCKTGLLLHLHCLQGSDNPFALHIFYIIS